MASSSFQSVLRDVLNIGEGNEILLITDDIQVAKYFSHEASMIHANITISYLPDEIRPMSALPKSLEAAIRSSDVVLTVFRTFRHELKFRTNVINTILGTKTRLAHMPDVNTDTITNCILKTDFDELEKLSKLLLPVVARAKKVRIISKAGTNLSLDLGGWLLPTDAGYKRTIESGQWDNLPTGEVFKIPTEGSANGKLVIDGVVPGRVLNAKEKIVFKVRKGMIVDIKENLRPSFKEYLEKVDFESSPEEKGGIYKICEFGIGTNRFARNVPQSVEYEKRLGTVHIAIGENRPFNGNIKAPDHLDLLIRSPTVFVDNVKIMTNGQLIRKACMKICCHDIENYRSIIPIRIAASCKIMRTRDKAIALPQDGKLIRFWRSPAKILYDTMIGDKNTAKIAAIAFERITRDGISLAELAKSIEIPNLRCTKLMHILYDFRIIDIVQDNTS